jgi:peptide/nickel transport system substrate-binding protein
MNRSKTLWRVLAVLFAFVLIAAACGSDDDEDSSSSDAAAEEEEAAPEEDAAAEEEEAAPEEDAAAEDDEEVADEEAASGDTSTIIIGTTDATASLDSADAYATHDWELIRAFNEPLLRFEPGSDAVLVPGIAELPTVSDDGLVWTLQLKDGLVFGDGTELTVEMAVEQLNRLLTISETGPNQVGLTLTAPYVESIAVGTAANTIDFTLLQPAGFFPQILAGGPYTIAHPDIFTAEELNLFPEPPIYGLGPWIITQFVPGEQTVLEPNPNYTGDFPAQVDQIVVREFATPDAMADAVRTGEIDIAWRLLGSEAAEELTSESGLTVTKVDSGPIRYLIPNHSEGFDTADANVRKALASIVDRDELSDVVFGGSVTPLLSPVPPGFMGATESYETLYQSPDLDAAIGFLEAAGYSEDNKLELELAYPPEHYGVTTADGVLLIAQQFEATGMIEVDIISQEWSTYVGDCTNGVYEVCVLGWFFDFPDAENYMQPFIEGDGLGTLVLSNPDTPPELEGLLLEQRSEGDLAIRASLLEDLQAVYADAMVTLPLWIEPEYIIYRDGIAGAEALQRAEALNIGPTFNFVYSVLTKS